MPERLAPAEQGRMGHFVQRSRRTINCWQGSQVHVRVVYDGTDAFSFSALPAGYRGYNGGYYSEGGRAYFWSSTEVDSILAYQMILYNITGNAYLGNYDMFNGFSVRCLKD